MRSTESEIKGPADYVLIDDKKMNRETWQIFGKLKKKNVATFDTVESFFKIAKLLNKDAKIYVDSHLSDDIKGEDVSKEIAEQGFQEIYLCTGYSPKDFQSMPWIKEVVGKDVPF